MSLQLLNIQYTDKCCFLKNGNGKENVQEVLAEQLI
jgi:hypothetical protein